MLSWLSSFKKIEVKKIYKRQVKGLRQDRQITEYENQD